MRTFVAYTSIFIYVIGLLKPIAPFIEFELNKDYIQEFLCINKEEPITVCGGKCYLAKELKKATEQAPQSSRTNLKVNLADYPIGFVEILDIQVISQQLKKIGSNAYSDHYSHLSTHDIFHPPRVKS